MTFKFKTTEGHNTKIVIEEVAGVEITGKHAVVSLKGGAVQYVVDNDIGNQIMKLMGE